MMIGDERMGTQMRTCEEWIVDRWMEANNDECVEYIMWRVSAEDPRVGMGKEKKEAMKKEEIRKNLKEATE
jgi:hypothetical protein